MEIDLDNPIKKIEKLIADNGGTNVKRDNWGKRKLAYPIRRQDFAVYVYWEVDLPPESIAKLDRAFILMDEILRHLITKHVEIPVVEEKEPKPDEEAPAKESKKEEKE